MLGSKLHVEVKERGGRYEEKDIHFVNVSIMTTIITMINGMNVIELQMSR